MKNFIARAALAVPILMAAQPALAGSLQRLDADHVAVRAAGVPMGQLLGELDGMMRLDNLFIEPAIEKRVVTVNIDRVTLADAAVQILKESGLDFIVWGRRIFVGDPTTAVQLARQGTEAEPSRRLRPLLRRSPSPPATRSRPTSTRWSARTSPTTTRASSPTR